jgi:hypothetical protein
VPQEQDLVGPAQPLSQLSRRRFASHTVLDTAVGRLFRF